MEDVDSAVHNFVYVIVLNYSPVDMLVCEYYEDELYHAPDDFQVSLGRMRRHNLDSNYICCSKKHLSYCQRHL